MHEYTHQESPGRAKKLRFLRFFKGFRDNQKAEETSLTSTSQPYIANIIYTHTHKLHIPVQYCLWRAAASSRRLCSGQGGDGGACCGYGPKHSHMLPLLPLLCFGQQKSFFILAFMLEGKFYLSFAVIAKPTTTTTANWKTSGFYIYFEFEQLWQLPQGIWANMGRDFVVKMRQKVNQ